MSATARLDDNQPQPVLAVRSYIDRRVQAMVKFIKEVRWHRESSTTTLLYRDYTITVAATKDEITGNFTPLIQIV